MKDLGIIDQPLLLFGGPYSNLQATFAIKEKARELQIDSNHIICTGDIVAYCADAQKTVEEIRDWGIHVVMGNCEESLGFEKEDCGCGFDEGTLCAALSIDWYRHASGQINDDQRAWMRTLPRQIRFTMGGRQFSVIHGGVSNISEFVFESSDKEKKYHDISSLDSECIIGGHSGIPFGQQIRDRYWLNAGVIGMPANDSQQHGWLMVLEPGEDEILASWHQLDFDTSDTVASMHTASLSTEYQTALMTGLWPSLSILPEYERQRQGIPLSVPPLSIS